MRGDAVEDRRASGPAEPDVEATADEVQRSLAELDVDAFMRDAARWFDGDKTICIPRDVLQRLLRACNAVSVFDAVTARPPTVIPRDAS